MFELLGNINKKIGKAWTILTHQGTAVFIRQIKLNIVALKHARAFQLLRIVKSRLYSYSYDRFSYRKWIKKNEPLVSELNEQRKKRFSYEPKISIVVPTFNTPKQFLKDMIRSVLNQTYSNWELCIADGRSQNKHIKDILLACAKRDRRINVKLLDENKGIAGNSNEALSLADGDFIALLDHDDMLPPFALFEVVQAINDNCDADFIYSDEDKVTENGKSRFEPHFKPDWSPDLLRSCNYITHLSVIKKELLDRIGHFRNEVDGSQDYDLILRATEKATRILHIPKILYHWRISANSAAGNTSAKTYAYDAAQKALRDHLARIGVVGTVEHTEYTGLYRISYCIKDNLKVSIVILFLDQITELIKCITSVLEKTVYDKYELIIVNANLTHPKALQYFKEVSKSDRVTVQEWRGPLNVSAMNNFGAEHASGDVLLFLSGTSTIINNDWIEKLLEHAMRKEVGAVGAKLYCENGTIRHAGIMVDWEYITGHPHNRFQMDSAGYMGRLQVVQNFSAVTGACLMMRKGVYSEVNGFDLDYPTALSDVDLCFKVRGKGYVVVWTPYAELFFTESKVDERCVMQRKGELLKKEVELFKRKWANVIEKVDPYYNINQTCKRKDFTLKIK